MKETMAETFLPAPTDPEEAAEAIASVERFFNSPLPNDKGTRKRADAALKMLGRINRNESSRLKATALALQKANASGLRGSALNKLLCDLNPAFAGSLPVGNEATTTPVNDVPNEAHAGTTLPAKSPRRR